MTAKIQNVSQNHRLRQDKVMRDLGGDSNFDQTYTVGTRVGRSSIANYFRKYTHTVYFFRF